MTRPGGDRAPWIALGAARRQVANLHLALETCRTISMAVGIVMVRRDCDPRDAFDALAASARHRRRRVRDLAVEVVAARDLEPVEAGRSAGGPVGGEQQHQRREQE